MQQETLQHALNTALKMVDEAKQKHRAQMHLDTFGNIAILTVTIHKRTATLWFLDNVRAYSYWFSQAERAPLVKKLHYEGMTNKRIGEFLGVCPSTIGKDLKRMRESGEIDSNKRLTRSDFTETLKLRDYVADADGIKKVTDLRDFAFGRTFRAA